MAEINLDKIYASFLIRLEECNSNDDLNELNKDFLAKDYKKYNKQIIDLEKKISHENEKPNFISEELRKRQYLSG